MSQLGGLIVRIRRARGWTRVDLAHAAGLPYTTVRNIEQGIRSKKPDEANVRAIAAALDNEPDVMLVLAGYGPAPNRTHERVVVELDALGEEAPKWKDAIDRAIAEMSASDLELTLDVLLAHIAAAHRRKGP